MTYKRIRFRKKQLDILFPATHTKLRPEDFINLAHQHKDILNQREFEALLNIRTDMYYGKFRTAQYELYAVKKKGYIELVPLDNE